ncbi:EF-hand family [Trichomonas vaginalis G3]|uniref:EF-hand family n=1 Tax=Trichomonas vaginalis (strain ATCC PRA-98 / G3) TaxID=412133 RepID=UPI0021E563C6|nr:EF-hand family [Trichomonas vaginalis G3]KAI5497850.1 EF-hand family [Trichomonas vaginalis G3]
MIKDQALTLKQIFENNSELGSRGESVITEDRFRRMLLDFDIDDSLTSPLFKLIGGWHCEGITYDQFSRFVNDLQSKDQKYFYQYLFRIFDYGSDDQIDSNDLIEFSKLIGDPLKSQEAMEIIYDLIDIDDIEISNDIPTVDFNQFEKRLENDISGR